MADPANSSSSPATSPDNAAKLISMGDFAKLIKERVPTLKDVPDDAVVTRALEAKPELGRHFIIGEPRRPMDSTRMGSGTTGGATDPTRTRLGRTPTTDQRVQKFFENHPITREIALKGISALGAPESQHVMNDFGKGVWNTISDPPKTADEHAAGPALPVYRIAKGLVQQAYGYGQDAFNAVDWNATLKKFKEGRRVRTMPL